MLVNRAWVIWSLCLFVVSVSNRLTSFSSPEGLLVHVKGGGVVLAQSSAPIAPMVRERNSLHQIAMGRQLSINNSTAEQLETVPHIGPVRAAEIVRNRREKGNFLSVGDLKRVRGIGPRTVQKVAQYLRH